MFSIKQVESSSFREIRMGIDQREKLTGNRMPQDAAWL